MRKILLTLATFMIFCLTVKAQNIKSNWVYRDGVDEMTNDHYYSAETTDTTREFPAGIVVRYKNKKNEVLFVVSGAVLNFGTYGMAFKAKFDDRKIETFSAERPSDGSFNTAFIHGKYGGSVSGFLKELKASKEVLIEIEIYDKGTRVYKFNTAGLKWDYL